jgi:hypothetical protein
MIKMRFFRGYQFSVEKELNYFFRYGGDIRLISAQTVIEAIDSDGMCKVLVTIFYK